MIQKPCYWLCIQRKGSLAVSGGDISHICCSTIHNRHPPKCSLEEEWIMKIWYICKMEYYLAIKMKEPHLTTMWINLKDTVLSKISHTQKVKYCMISLTCRILRKGKERILNEARHDGAHQ